MMVLEFSNVMKSFGGLVAVNDLSFHIEKGEIIGLIGPNGAGKTTVYNLITGFLRPDSGEIYFGKEKITNLRPDQINKKGIARTFQLVKPFLNMSVFENILCGSLSKNINMYQAEEEATEILQMIGLSQKRDVLAKNLILADRKMLDLGRALATKPQLLIIDEVASGLTPTELTKSMKLLTTINKTGITLCVVEHIMKFVMSLTNRIVVLDKGRKICEGTPKDVASDSTVIKAYLGESAYA